MILPFKRQQNNHIQKILFASVLMLTNKQCGPRSGAVRSGSTLSKRLQIFLQMTKANNFCDMPFKGLINGLRGRKPVFGVCEQQRHRPACALAKTDQRLCYSLFGKYHM